MRGSSDSGRAVQIRIPKKLLGNATRADFLKAARVRFNSLAAARLPGAAWFRMRVNAIDAETGTKPEEARRADRGLFAEPEGNPGEIQETYEFFSAGRAVSENLRLDRSLVPIDGGEPTIPIEAVPGIDTKAFDWKAATEKLAPRKDALAALIPEDQHAAIFKHLLGLEQLVDALEAQLAPIAASATERSEEAGLRALYEGQLGFKLSEAARDPIISAFVKTVAVTGSDPYFATGTDLAVLIEAVEPKLAYAALELKQRALSKARPDAKISGGDLEGTAYSWIRTEDRSVSSVIASVGPAVVITNSLAQLKRIVAASRGATPALASSLEYVFFRDRYPIGYNTETAFVLLTDACIRRWCGPRWRIADARRTRAAAQLANLTAENAGAIVRGVVKPGPFDAPNAPQGLGALTWTADAIHSGDYGNLRFLTPIIELDVPRVTNSEVSAYGQFREVYQRRWRQFFDPIAIRLDLSVNVMGLDVTVMPLVEGSDYRDLMDLARSSRFGPNACDPHEKALVHLTLAVDAAAAAAQDWEKGIRRLSADPKSVALSWLKGGVSIALDQDPMFENLGGEDAEERISKSLHKLPIILTAEVKDPVSLAVLLTGVRAGIEEMGVGSVRWTKGKHRDVETMTLSGIPGFSNDEKSLSIRYAITDGLLIVTVREDLLHQAIDRAIDRREGKAAESRPWLGESAALRVNKTFIDFVAKESQKLWDESQRELAWRALPILQEWRRLWPDQDPVAVHEKLFKVRLVDPAGGGYVVDKDGLRIFSETYGHPTEARSGPARPRFAERLKEARGGLTFENDGVRARLVIEREGK
jgi:hypothetical protein